MSIARIKKDVEFEDDVIVVNRFGTLQTGLVDGDFTKKLYNPDSNEVSGSISVVVTELGDGSYRVAFTPDALGLWLLILTNSTHFPFGQSANYLCIDNLNDDLATKLDTLLESGSGSPVGSPFGPSGIP